MEIIKNVYQNVEYIYYIDESTACNEYICTALGIPIKQWNHIFARIKAFRQYISKEYGIQLYKELHATKFVNGRGAFTKDRVVTKFQRSEVFKLCLETLAKEHNTGIHTFSTKSEKPIWSLERMITRINNNAEQNDFYALAFFDSGNEGSTHKVLRRMRSINYIPSKFGLCDGDNFSKNLPATRIVADAMFLDSSRDYMIQVADFIAYSVKTFYEPSSNALKYDLKESYLILKPIFLKQATNTNDYAIVE